MSSSREQRQRIRQERQAQRELSSMSSEQLELEADRILGRCLTSRHPVDKGDILSPSQLTLRRSREIYAVAGTVDPSIRSGLYRRSYGARGLQVSCSRCYWRKVGRCPKSCSLKTAAKEGPRENV